MNVYLLTPYEAALMLVEYDRYHAYGPPYQDSPNMAELKRRDRMVTEALLRRSRMVK